MLPAGAFSFGLYWKRRRDDALRIGYELYSLPHLRRIPDPALLRQLQTRGGHDPHDFKNFCLFRPRDKL